MQNTPTSRADTKHPLRFVDEAAPWFAELRARGLSPRTLANGRTALVAFGQFLKSQNGPSNASGVQLCHLERWQKAMRGRKLKALSIMNYADTVRRYFAWLVRTGRLFSSPAADLAISSPPRRMQFVPSESEVGRLIAAVPTDTAYGLRDRAMVETLYSSGLRAAEFVAMDLSSVDLPNRTVRVVRKGGREQVLPLTRAAAEAIKHYLKCGRPTLAGNAFTESALWLAARPARRMKSKHLAAILRRYGRDTGVPVTPHALRRAFATHMLQHGAHPMMLKELLGHQSFRHLKYYLQYAPMAVVAAHKKSVLSR